MKKFLNSIEIIMGYLTFATRLGYMGLIGYMIFAPYFGFPAYEFTLENVFFLLLLAVYIESDRIISNIKERSVEIEISGMSDVTRDECDCFGFCEECR